MEKAMLYILLATWLFIGNCYCIFFNHSRGHGNTTTKLRRTQMSILNAIPQELSYDAALADSREQISLIDVQSNETASDVVKRELYKGVTYDMNDCLNIFKQKDKCHWLRETEHCKTISTGRIVSYMEIVFCYMNEDHAYYSIIWMVLLLIPLVSTVILICTRFYVSAILAAATVLKFPEDFAGITLVSMFNGSADVIRSVQFVRIGRADVQYSYIMGGSIVMIVLLLGMICINTPFRIEGPPFLRDCLFTLAAVLYSFILLISGHVNILEVAGFFLLYCMYLLLAILQLVFRSENFAGTRGIQKAEAIVKCCVFLCDAFEISSSLYNHEKKGNRNLPLRKGFKRKYKKLKQ